MLAPGATNVNPPAKSLDFWAKVRVTQSTPPRIKAHMALQDPASPVITVLYSPCSEDKGECLHPQTDPIDGPNHHLKFKSGSGN